jgi:hypothetical protein
MCTIFNISLGPPVGIPPSVRAPLEPIKGRAHTLEHKALESSLRKSHRHTSFHKLSQAIQHTVDVRFYAPVA